MIRTSAMISRRLCATPARLFAAALCAIASVANAAEPRVTGFAARADVKAFIADMAMNDGFDAAALTRVFAQVSPQPKVIAAMSRPLVEPPKWYEYVPRFLDPARVDAGVEFWRANDTTLARAQAEFGVPAEIIVAIIGVETYYGRNTGSYRVIDALATLAFDYPRRAAYFSGELRQFLLLAREQGVSPLLAKGSFAGAVGLPQFMPGSIRSYAVDYDGDGRIDLVGEVDDAVGSVANYLERHGWQRGPAGDDAGAHSGRACRCTPAPFRWRHHRTARRRCLGARRRDRIHDSRRARSRPGRVADARRRQTGPGTGWCSTTGTCSRATTAAASMRPRCGFWRKR